jgi:hypothetical protein
VSNVIDFLERFGGDAQLRYAADDEVESALKLAGIDQAVRAAIVSKDQRALEALLGADTNVCCLVEKPEDEEEDEVEDDEDDEDDDDEFDEDEDDEDDDEDDDDDEDEDEDEEDDEEEARSRKRVAERVA